MRFKVFCKMGAYSVGSARFLDFLFIEPRTLRVPPWDLVFTPSSWACLEGPVDIYNTAEALLSLRSSNSAGC